MLSRPAAGQKENSESAHSGGYDGQGCCRARCEIIWMQSQNTLQAKSASTQNGLLCRRLWHKSSGLDDDALPAHGRTTASKDQGDYRCSKMPKNGLSTA